MSFVLGRGFVDIDLDTGKFQRGVSAVESRLRGMQKNLQGAASFARKFLVGAAAAGGGSIVLAGRQEKQEAKLAAVIRATGGAAGKTADELKLQASALQELTGYADDSILSMQAVLLTFKNIKGDTFDRTTKAALDLSAVLDTDLKSAALQLGKALEDPTKGMSALTRSGVSFSKQEQDTIKALQESGNLLEAQNLMLKAVEGQVKGTAEAMNTGINKELNYLKNNASDTAEEFGAALAPALVELTKLVRDILPPIREFIKENPRLVAGLFGFSIGAAASIAVLPRLIGLIASLTSMVGFLAAHPVVLAIAAVTSLGMALGLLATAFNRSEETGQTFGDSLREISSIALFAAQNIGTLVTNVRSLLAAMGGELAIKLGRAFEAGGDLFKSEKMRSAGRFLQEVGESVVDDAADTIAKDIIDEDAIDRRLEALRKRLADKRKKKPDGGSPGGGVAPPPTATELKIQSATNSFASTMDVFRRLSTTNPARTAEKQAEKTNELLESIDNNTKKAADGSGVGKFGA